MTEIDSDEKNFYDKMEQHINTLDEKYRQKIVIRHDLYNQIQQSLALPKGLKSDLYKPVFTYWVKRNFILINIAGNEIVACIKTKKPVCIYESFYNVICEAHTNISHGGREKTMFELNSQYSWIPRFTVEIFLKHCISCQTRKPIKHKVVSKPIIALGVMTRLQIDLIDMRTRPDKISEDLVYCWILNCIDHFSKFSWAFPLRNKSAGEVATKLRELCFTFGPPRIIHSDNGKEFLSSVIMDLKTLFPELVFIRGRPSHPQSQGCIERANGVLCDALGKWLSSNDFSSWSYGLLPVVHGINTRMSHVTKTSPYEIMFEQPPRADSEYWKLIRDSGIEDEEDLVIPVAEEDADLITNEDVVSNGSNITMNLTHQPPSDDATCSSINCQSGLNQSPATTTSTLTQHSTVRRFAEQNYLANVNKKKKLYEESSRIIANNYGINDCVGIEIHSVDRTNTDPKHLPCLIIDKFEKNGVFLFKLICEYGELVNTFEAGQFVCLKDACPKQLKEMNRENLKPIGIIEASRLYSRGSTTGRTCNCRAKCATRTCPCRRENVPCSTKCHSKIGGCSNME